MSTGYPRDRALLSCKGVEEKYEEPKKEKGNEPEKDKGKEPEQEDLLRGPQVAGDR